MTWAASAFAARLVALDEGSTKQTIERRHLLQQPASAPAQNNRSLFAQLGAHNCQCTYITGLLIWLVGQIDSFVNPSLVNTVGEPRPRRSKSSTNSRSELILNRRADISGEGSAQLVHSRATQKVPCSSPCRIRVSIPAKRRFFSTGKLWPRNGWKGCWISTQPKGSLC